MLPAASSVTPSTCYGTGVVGPAGWGGVYQIDGSTGAVSTFTTAALPNTGPGLGNIVYDCGNDQFFVTNHEDGKIYRLDNGGTVASSFDHATPDDGLAGFAPLRERLWGVTVHNGRVYYGVWNEDSANPSAALANEVWSVALNGSGDFTGAAQLEVSVPPNPSAIYSNPVADIRFTAAGTMLLAERGMSGPTFPTPHQSRLLEYVCSPGGWAPSTNLFDIGTIPPSSCAGGCDADYSTNGRYWSTGDALQFFPNTIYGLQGLPTTGGTTANSVLVDYQGNLLQQDKTQIGDVALACAADAPCVNISNEKVACPEKGEDCYTYTFDITNKSGFSVKYVTLPVQATSPAGVTLSPNVINLLLQDGSLLDDGETTTISIVICGAEAGDEVCFEISLKTATFVECCFEEICVEIPTCDCGELLDQEITQVSCDADGFVTFTYCFTLHNLSGFDAEHVIFIPFNDESAIFAKDFFELPPLAAGDSMPFCVTIIGAEPGEEFCFFVVFEHPGDDCCCGFEKCVTVPECPDVLVDGACCFPTGLPCVIALQSECEAMGGVWQGPLTPCTVCDPVELPGACCIPGAPCFLTNDPAQCAAAGGTFLGFGTTCAQCPFPDLCRNDFNGDDVINGMDLAMLLGAWTGMGTYRPCLPIAQADCNGDCHIDGLDLAILLGSWGGCP
jgi:hypothetical protein